MSERIVIDPITRIEGHLRVEAEIEGGTIKNAYSSGTMVRGIENIVKDRDPRDVWAFVGRVCGVLLPSTRLPRYGRSRTHGVS